MGDAIPTLYACALVAYDGTAYHGFQYQVGVPTIQGTLEEALQRFAEPVSRVVGAGRTDAGVHASGQVVAVQVRWRHSLGSLLQAWNAHLPADICVRRVVQVPEGFHPRFSAVARTYRYWIYVDGTPASLSRPRRSPLTDRYALFEPGPLDVARMNRAAALLRGQHDFATFGQPTQGDSTVRRVDQAEWQVVETNLAPLAPFPGHHLVFTVTANGFLRQMVRTLVGALLEVGRGRWSLEMLEAALQARDRSQAPPPVAPAGLVLERVHYPPDLAPFHTPFDGEDGSVAGAAQPA